MSKEFAECIVRLKSNSTDENKKSFVSMLISNKFFVPIAAETAVHNAAKTGYYSIHSEKGSFLLMFTSIEAMSKWKKAVQFLELGYNDICSIVDMPSLGYAGILIDSGGNSIALKKELLDKVKRHIT